MKSLKKENIYLYGAGMHGKVLSDLMLTEKYNITGFIDDYIKGKSYHNIPILNFNHNKMKVLMLSLGNEKTIPHKIKLYEKLKKYNIKYPNYIHKSSIISKTSIIGIGNQIFPRVIINNESKIGNFCIINTGSIIEHNCYIDDFSSISPGSILCGEVIIGKGTFIGANSTIINGIKIGDNVIIGAGSTVIRDIPKNTVFVGCPARKIKNNENS